MKIEETFPHDMYRFLRRSVREDDEKQNFLLERMLEGPQFMWENMVADIDALDTLHDLDAIEDKYLTYLKHHLGWTKEVDSITEDLTDAQLRKLLRASVAFWKLKGTGLGLEDAVRIITGRDVVLRDWFAYRFTLDVSQLWLRGHGVDSFVLGSDHGDRDQYLSVIWISNENDPPKQLLRDIVNLQRPLQEAYIISYADLVDDFFLGRQKWLYQVGDDVVWDEDRRLITLPGNSVSQVNVENTNTWDEFVWRQSLSFTDDAGGEFEIRFRQLDEGNYYSVAFLKSGDIEVRKSIANVVTVLSSDSIGYEIPTDENQVLGFDVVHPTDSTIRVIPVFYETEYAVVDFTPELGLGAAAIANPGAYDVEIDNVIAYALPLDWELVEG